MPEPEVPKVNGLSLALTVLQIANVATPMIAEWIMLIRRKDGTVSLISMLEEGSTQFDANIKQATDWLKTHEGVK